MQGTLVLAILKVKSSYSDNIELPTEGKDDPPDTLQWWLAPNGVWRIKTFALDHDIHIHSINANGPEMLQLAQDHNVKHYGDIIDWQHVLAFANCQDPTEVNRQFATIHLPPRLEVAPAGFAFWKPDESSYRTKSQPQT